MNSLLVGVLMALVASAVTARSTRSAFTDLLDDEWDIFKVEHSKSYENSIEERFRRKVYLENRQRIARHNKNPKTGFKLKMNNLGDLLPHEINAKLNGYRMELRGGNKTKMGGIVFMPPMNLGAVPDSIDWREKGFVTPVKNQGDCGSCWSFSTTGALEGQHMRRTGKLVSLSEQNLIDCSRGEGNNGCGGGLMDYAFKYVQDNHGIDTEDSYPYEGTDDNQCRFRSADIGADDKGYVDIPQGDEDALMQAVATVGPVSVAIDASQESFHFYHSGVYYDEECSSEQLDHGVLVVGYGSEDGMDYWLVKNSWGDWGDQGYIKMARNRDNNCGIASGASYPIV